LPALHQLEETDRKSPVDTLVDDLPLFSTAQTGASAEPETDAVADMIDGIAPDELTPREALEALYRLKTARAAKRE